MTTYDPQDWPDASEIEIKQEREIEELKLELAQLVADRDEWRHHAEELAVTCGKYQALATEYSIMLAEFNADVDTLILQLEVATGRTVQ